MITKSFITTYAFYARTICTLVKKAGEFSSNTTLEHEGKKANLKSYLSVLSLSVPEYTTVILKVEGTDEENAIDAIENVIKEKSLGRIIEHSRFL